MRTIVVTAASEMTLRDFDRTSVFALMRKPFDVNELLEQVGACIAPSRRLLTHQAGKSLEH